MKNVLYLLMLLFSFPAFSQASSKDSRKKLENLQEREKFLTTQIAQLEDSLKVVQASIKSEEKNYEQALILDAVDSIRTVIGQGIKLKTGQESLTVIQDDFMNTTIGKKQDYVLSGVDVYPIYFLQYKKKRYRVNIQYVDLKGTKIYDMNERLAKRLQVSTYSSVSKPLIKQPGREEERDPVYYSPPSPSPSSTYERSPNHSQSVQTGPRGGKYVITASGKKRYVKH